MPLPAARKLRGKGRFPRNRRGAEQRLPETGRNSSAAAVTPQAAPAGPAGKPAAAQRGASPAGRGWGRQEGGETRQEPARRPVPSPRSAAALPPQRDEPAVPGASSLLPRAGIAEHSAAGPAPLHPAALPDPPQLCQADNPPRVGGWFLVLVAFFFFKSPPPFPSLSLSPHYSSGSLPPSPGHSPRCNPSRFLDGAARLCQSRRPRCGACSPARPGAQRCASRSAPAEGLHSAAAPAGDRGCFPGGESPAEPKRGCCNSEAALKRGRVRSRVPPLRYQGSGEAHPTAGAGLAGEESCRGT